MMYSIERHKEILSVLEKNSNVSVHKLAKLLFTSESTVRRDLTELERQGKIRRTFGGAVLSDDQTKEIPLILRQSRNLKEKRELATKAVSKIRDGSILFFDASSTILQLVPHLSKFHNLTVITNGPLTSMELAKLHVQTYCTGGKLLPNSLAYVGADAENFLRNINADAMFASCRGLSDDGLLTDSSLEESHIRKIMIQQSKEQYFILDSEKLHSTYFYTITKSDRITEIITSVEEN
ncbi:MAG: DeoR/GlpR transcriptional regulator [Clostridia bacterium]|nr:DeoR/GlpR transcriptional regulator [Clostridia bacterium]